MLIKLAYGTVWINIYVPIPKLTKKSIFVTIKEYKTAKVLHTDVLHNQLYGTKSGTPGDDSGGIVSTLKLMTLFAQFFGKISDATQVAQNRQDSQKVREIFTSTPTGGISISNPNIDYR